MTDHEVGSAAQKKLFGEFVEQAARVEWPMPGERLEEGWQRLRGTLPASARQLRPALPRRAWLRPTLFAGVAAALLLLVFVSLRVVSKSGSDTLRYTAHNLVTSGGRSFTASSQEDSRLLFSDGSQVGFSAHTQVTLVALSAHGAHLRLVDGALDVSVEPSARNAWRFVAGPFRVEVKGTAFHLEFSAERGRLGLRMKHGRVEVLAPPSRTLAVGAGEAIELCANQPSVSVEKTAQDFPLDRPQLEPSDSRPTGDARPEPSAPRKPSRHVVARAEERSEPAATERPPDWSKLIKQGDYASVVADAERRGLDTTIAQASATDLAHLADACRYTRRFDLARRVLFAMRARFAGSQSSRDAAFFLGRLAESVPDRPQEAIPWYETYLREAPRGTYASEALGREMTLLAPSDPGQARKLARRYLDRFPRGPQAELAHSLVETNAE